MVDLWPFARALNVSSDVGSGEKTVAATPGNVARGEVDIVVGTQRVAKGRTPFAVPIQCPLTLAKNLQRR